MKPLTIPPEAPHTKYHLRVTGDCLELVDDEGCLILVDEVELIAAYEYMAWMREAKIERLVKALKDAFNTADFQKCRELILEALAEAGK